MALGDSVRCMAPEDSARWPESVSLDRREFVVALGTTGAVGLAGCGAVRGEETLSDPTVHENGPARRSIEWTDDDGTVGEFGGDADMIGGELDPGLIDLSTELSHREGTEVESIDLRIWMPSAGSPADVAVVSPVEGDSSPPPSLSLYTPDREEGTAIAVEDLDDLADETIDTLAFMIRPPSMSTATLAIDATIELTGGGIASTDYTLEGRLEFPDVRTPTS